MSARAAPPQAADALIVGGGFAGSILSRALRSRGLDVTLVEKDRHPRFALGESSTPLANLSLERLALRYGLEDLYQLAAHGRWCRRLPEVQRGLKRGFTFFRHRPGEGYEPGPGQRDLLMVAASPDDEVADCQWLRADVDHHLARAAAREGVRFLEGAVVEEITGEQRGVRVTVACRGLRREIEARHVVDASGAAAVAARAFGARARSSPAPFSTRLLFTHLAGVPPFLESGALPSPLPYPAEWSAVHHLIDAGWIYQLRFDDGRVSFGAVVEEAQAERAGLDLDWAQPESSLRRLVGRFPSLARQLEPARTLLPVRSTSRLQRRLDAAGGARWSLVPHTYAFFSPLFSTGIAWSLLAVERLAEALTADTDSLRRRRLEAHHRLLEKEADHLERLLTAAYQRLRDPEGFVAVAECYFAAASFTESCQRMLEPGEWPAGEGEAEGGWPWRGFLGATDPVLAPLFAGLRERALSAESGRRLRRWTTAAIAPRNVAGLGRRDRGHLLPADPEEVLRGRRLLGLSLDEARRRMDRLRSPDEFETALHELGPPRAQGSKRAL